MKILKILTTSLIIGAITFLSISCSSGSNSTSTVRTQVATVQKGSISVTVTGTGNLALENKQQLSFGQTGQANNATTSKISEVNVVAGQTVDQGQVLVKADTQDWQDQITSDQHNLDSAKDALLKAQNQLITDQNKLKTDQNTLSQVNDVMLIQQQKDNANTQLQQAKLMLQQAAAQQGDVQYWQKMIDYYSISPTYKDNTGKPMADGGLLGYYEKQMADLLTDPAYYLASDAMGSNAPTGFDTSSTTSQAIIKLQTQIQQDQLTIQQDQSAINLRQNAVDDAQTTLDNDKAASQEIVAPFKGLITKIYTDSNGNTLAPGDIVARNTSLIEIADPDKFIANILVTERDVMSIKVGGDANVSFDALQGYSFPAKITQIAPLATTSQGVVNYKVTVELTSLTPVTNSAAASQNTLQSITGSSLPTNLPSGGSMPTNLPANTPAVTTNSIGSTATTAAENISLKDGLSATVTITVQQKDNVLMIPNKAIKNSTVQIINGSTSETRSIKTGITDSTNTEVISGLQEGEQVQYTTSTSSSTSSNTGGGVGLPPGGF